MLLCLLVVRVYQTTLLATQKRLMDTPLQPILLNAQTEGFLTLISNELNCCSSNSNTFTPSVFMISEFYAPDVLADPITSTHAMTDDLRRENPLYSSDVPFF